MSFLVDFDLMAGLYAFHQLRVRALREHVSERFVSLICLFHRPDLRYYANDLEQAYYDGEPCVKRKREAMDICRHRRTADLHSLISHQRREIYGPR